MAVVEEAFMRALGQVEAVHGGEEGEKKALAVLGVDVMLEEGGKGPVGGGGWCNGRRAMMSHDGFWDRCSHKQTWPSHVIRASHFGAVIGVVRRWKIGCSLLGLNDGKGHAGL